MKRVLWAIGALLCGSAAGAQTLGAGVDAWSYDAAGFVEDNGERLDFDDDLDVRERPARGYRIEVPGARGWPDWQADFSQIGGRGRRVAEQTLNFGPLAIAAGSSVLSTNAHFDDADLTARWRWRRGALLVRPGISVKSLRGEVVITDTSNGQASRQPYDELFPLLHVGLSWAPARTVGLSAAVQGAAYRGNRALEWRAAVDVGLFRPLYLHAGWQEKGYEIDLENYRLDARLRGPVFGLEFRLPR